MATRSRKAPNSAQDVCPLLTGMAIPDLVLKSAEGSRFDLAKAVKQKPTVLVFYRGGW
jgi:peroxiredoxin